MKLDRKHLKSVFCTCFAATAFSIGSTEANAGGFWEKFTEKFTTEYYSLDYCNHSPYVQNPTISVGSKYFKKQYRVIPGECNRLRVEENTSVYVNGTKFRVEDDDTPTPVKLYFPRIGILSLEDAAESYKRSEGAKRYLAMVKDRSHLEAPFTLGLLFQRRSNVIAEAIPGMPGYDAGLEAGDRIISIDRKRIYDLDDYSDFMNSISLKRTSLLLLEVKKRTGEVLKGEVQPDFFRENHWHFREGGAWSAFTSQVIDGITLGLLSEADSGFRNKLELDSSIYETASAAGFGASFFVGGTGLLKAGKAGSRLNKASKVSNLAKSSVPLTNRRRNLLDALKTNYRPFSSQQRR